MDANATPSSQGQRGKLFKLFTKVKNSDNWPQALRLVLMFQGRIVTQEDSEAILVTRGTASVEEILTFLNSENEKRVGRITGSTTITGIIGALEGAIFIALFIQGGKRNLAEVIAIGLLAAAMIVFLWSITSGIQSLVMFFDRDPLEQAIKAIASNESKIHRAHQHVITRNTKATCISVCQTISALLAELSLVALVVSLIMMFLS